MEDLQCNIKSCVCLHTPKAITFGRRGNKLDLYHPPNMGQPEDVSAPLVVFIYGGAWGSGERAIYCLLARRMAEELNAVVICPDYCTYPKVRGKYSCPDDIQIKDFWCICKVLVPGI